MKMTHAATLLSFFDRNFARHLVGILRTDCQTNFVKRKFRDFLLFATFERFYDESVPSNYIKINAEVLQQPQSVLVYQILSEFREF